MCDVDDRKYIHVIVVWHCAWHSGVRLVHLEIYNSASPSCNAMCMHLEVSF